jgi:hypothetical protein
MGITCLFAASFALVAQAIRAWWIGKRFGVKTRPISQMRNGRVALSGQGSHCRRPG